MCSGLFVAGRNLETLLAVDVQAPGNPLLRLISVEVDHDRKIVSAAFLGQFARNWAMHRDELGCTPVPDGDFARVQAMPRAAAVEMPVADKTLPWPDGDATAQSANPAVSSILRDEVLVGPGMRAVVVVHDGRIVGEQYGEGFSSDTPLLGWSMTKTVIAALIGTATNRFDSLDEPNLRPDWTGDRQQIKLSDLLGMKSGLAFRETYGGISDVNRMLFLEPDMARFVARSQLEAAPGTTFNYSSGTTVLLARLLQDRFDTPEEALAWPRRALFAPLGMSSAVMETDASGTFIGSSFMYATARDWARFAQFLLQDGVWKGTPILPQGYVHWMRTPSAPSNGAYGQGQVWLSTLTRSGEGAALPGDTYWMRGHDGQIAAIIPSANLVIVRLGITPVRTGWSPAPLVARVLSVL
ncbi:hydrolase [Limoniibacter endophyticus]|uniref:Hydrolase n=1 Tax=Limoniibacter endophyticus TaxID=1565040 RepID=A0A8J3GH07_9HYPH|nr:hydrolase [Limoniibacter endophyticus]